MQKRRTNDVNGKIMTRKIIGTNDKEDENFDNFKLSLRLKVTLFWNF